MKYPYSIRCLRAIEALAGNRAELAKQLGVSVFSINRWVHERQIARNAILGLTRIGKEKFSAEELLGGRDDGPESQGNPN